MCTHVQSDSLYCSRVALRRGHVGGLLNTLLCMLLCIGVTGGGAQCGDWRGMQWHLHLPSSKQTGRWHVILGYHYTPSDTPTHHATPRPLNTPGQPSTNCSTMASGSRSTTIQMTACSGKSARSSLMRQSPSGQSASGRSA